MGLTVEPFKVYIRTNQLSQLNLQSAFHNGTITKQLYSKKKRRRKTRQIHVTNNREANS